MSQRNFQPKHRQIANKAFNGRKKIDAMYDTRWEAYRRRFLALNPECYACGKPAQVVDHLKPHQGCEKLFKKTDNHIPLCIHHHNTVTSLFDRKYVTGSPIHDKIKWLNEKRFSKGLSRRVKVLPSYE